VSFLILIILFILLEISKLLFLMLEHTLELQENFLLLGGQHSQHSVQKYFKDTWNTCADSPKPISRSAVATNNTHVFVVGGWKSEGHIQVYDVEKETWSVIEDILKTPRWDATATIINSKLYLSGGYDGNLNLPSTEVFTINGLSCVHCDDHGIPDLKVRRSFHASVTIQDEIYFIGGTSGRGMTWLSSFEMINVTTAESRELPSLNQARDSLSATVCDGKIFAVGGEEDYKVLDSVESYSFDTKQWTMMKPLSTPRYNHCSVVHNGQILVIGGECDYHSVNSIEVYDAETQEWIIHSPLEMSRIYASVIII